MRDLDTANQLTSFVFHPINYLWYDFDRDGSETWAMPTQPFFSSGKRQRLYFTLSYIWNLDVSEQVRMMKDSLVNIIAACLCHKLCVSSCWGMCQRFVSAARDSSCSGHWPSHQVQCLSGDNWVKIPPINVGVCHKSTQSKQCPAGCVGPCWPISGHSQSWLTNGVRDGGVGCCHGAPTFLSRPVHVCDSVVTCHDWRCSDQDSQQLERLDINQKQKYSMTKHCIGTDHCLLSVPGSWIIGDVDSDIMHYGCIYLIAESVVCCNVWSLKHWS